MSSGCSERRCVPPLKRTVMSTLKGARRAMAIFGQYAIRWRWLRFMYVYTTIVAGAFGLAEILAPARVQSMLDMPAQDPMVFGLGGSFFLAFGLVAVLGVRAPLKYCPVLLVELAYKLIWLCGVVVPLALRGEFPASSIVQVVIFGTFVVGDLMAIPFRYVFDSDISATAGSGE
jgi:hypothetical protein